MAKGRDKYRLWQHEVKPPKKSEQTVIAKVSADAAATTPMPAAMMSAGGRAAHRAGVTHESGLARLMDNGHVASIQNVFDEGTGDVDRAPSMFAAVSSTDRGARRGSPRLVELKVGKGTSASRLAAHVASMKEVEYAFVPPVRQLFARRKKAGVDPLASRQWGHGAIRLGHARAAKGFKNATNITIAVVDSGIDTSHPDLKHTDELDKRAGFSNTGRHIDLMAPGVSILSTTPTFRYDGDGEMEYDSWDGTSMATPFVAGVAALVLAKWPDLTPAQVIRKLTSSADRVAGAKKGSTSYGAGRLNCEKALR